MKYRLESYREPDCEPETHMNTRVIDEYGNMITRIQSVTWHIDVNNRVPMVKLIVATFRGDEIIEVPIECPADSTCFEFTLPKRIDEIVRGVLESIPLQAIPDFGGVGN